MIGLGRSKSDQILLLSNPRFRVVHDVRVGLIS
jgi:hypothetical protein